MAGIEEILEDLEQKRAKLSVKMHLASRDVQDQFSVLEGRWNEFRTEARLDRTKEGVSSALSLLGDELKRGYDRIKKAM